MAGVYIHIPFCKKACHYCDFHFSTSTKYYDRMLKALIMEIEEQSKHLKEPIQSIYFGGGTPSILEAKAIDALLNAVVKNYSCASDIEITLECNPDDGSLPYFKAIKSSGVNRLSVGIQSFSDRDLQYLGRAHDAQLAIQCLEQVRTAGFNNITADLIYGIPGSSEKQIIENVDWFLKMEIPHISAYALTIEENTALHHWIIKGDIAEPDDRFQNDQFYQIRAHLLGRGYEHYELSNYSLNGYRSRHNQSYWSRNHYLGIGPSAHSYIDGKRRWNISNNAQYMDQVEGGMPYYEEEALSEYSVYNEKVLVGLRKMVGVHLEDLGGFQNHFLSGAEEMIKKGWLERKDQYVRATAEGLIWLDHMSENLFLVEE